MGGGYEEFSRNWPQTPKFKVFLGLEGHFQGEIGEKKFSPKMCFDTLGSFSEALVLGHTLGGGGTKKCGLNPHFLFFFLFEGFPNYFSPLKYVFNCEFLRKVVLI